ncbi:MAG: hypothetical protein H6Q76_1419 [Firmicutes bacterium]|nr:hypothetical protein [Bacillota bacterium]
MKKVTQWFTAISLSVLMLAVAGCGGSQSNAPKAAGKTVIEYWHVNAESFGGPTVKQLVEQFNKENPDVEVVAKYNPDMYKGLTQNLQTAMASGKNPDVVQMGYSYLNYAGENLKYTSMQDIIAKLAPEDKTFMQDNYLPNVLSLATTDDGKQIGLPYSVSVPVLYYNPDIFRQAGLDPAKPPKTWQEVTQYAKIIKEKTGIVGFFMQEYADNLMIFSKEPEKQKAAWRFVKYLESPAALALWTKGTGYMPPRKGVAEDPKGLKEFVEQNKNMQVAMASMPDVVKWASFPGANGLQAEQALIDVRDIILSGKVTAAEALKQAAAKINSLL